MKPRILLFSKYMWPEGGGAELATRQFIVEILSRYFDITVVSSTENPDSAVLKCCKYIVWEAVGEDNKVRDWLFSFLHSNYLRDLVRKSDLVYITSRTLYPLAIAIKAIDPREPVIIHVHDYQPITFTASYYANIGGGIKANIVYEFREKHSIVRTFATGLLSYTNLLNRLALDYTDAVIFASKRQRDIIVSRISTLNGKSYVIYNPPPPIKILRKIPSAKPTVMFMGGSSYSKGFTVVLEALPKLFSLGIKLYISRATIESPDICRVLQRCNGFVEVVGKISYSHLIELLSTTWLTLHPSIYEEPLPYSVVESVLTHNMAIASRVGGIPELLNGTPMASFMFAPGSVEEFIDRIEKAITLGLKGILEITLVTAEIVKRRLITSSKMLVKVFEKLLCSR